jgi:hypothetical protein
MHALQIIVITWLYLYPGFVIVWLFALVFTNSRGVLLGPLAYVALTSVLAAGLAAAGVGLFTPFLPPWLFAVYELFGFLGR